MKTWFAMLLLAAVAAAGCQSQQKPAARTPSVLDVSAPQQSYTTTPGYQPSASATPSYMLPPASGPGQAAVAPVVETTAPGAVPASATASGSGKYTVKKGDTLYHIAKDKYGDGKQWQRIASANPGVSPTSLKVGQTLVMP